MDIPDALLDNMPANAFELHLAVAHACEAKTYRPHVKLSLTFKHSSSIEAFPLFERFCVTPSLVHTF